MADTDIFNPAKAAIGLEKVKGDIVTRTLDNLNNSNTGSTCKRSRSVMQNAMSDTYNLSRTVLSAYADKGSIIDSSK